MSWLEGEKALRWARLGIPLGGLVAIVAFGGLGGDGPLVGPTRLETVALDPHAALPAPPPSSPPTQEIEAPDRIEALRRGQTLGGVLLELGLSGEEAHAAAQASARFVDLRQLRPGARYAAFLDPEGELARFDLVLAGQGELSVTRSAEGWEPSFRAFERELRVRRVDGRLDGALERSIARAGANGELAYALAEVLQWDLDFNRDLQPGDRFRLLYEEIWLDGEYHGPGRVLAAAYEQDARRFEAFRFGDGYYDAEGRPLEKMFLRSPLPYSRVTSRFSHRRFHPVLGVFRPHHGVDYGAPTGTPVRATAAGTVTAAGWDGGGGRTVKLRHPNGYLTCYLHLSRFAAGIRSGARVGQGDVVGYVGSTGLATGPHLDYRVQHDGRWIDPLTLKSVPAEPLSRLELAEFGRARDDLRASLESGRPYPAPAADPAGSRLAELAAPAGRATAGRR